MKWILLALLLKFSTAFEFHPDETHTHETVPKDMENLRRRVDCALDRTPCDEINAAYVAIFPETLKTMCAKCSSETKKILNAYITSIQKNFPEDYVLFMKKFDPEKKYTDNFLKIIAADS